MSLATLFLLAVGLSMDAFAVSVCKGLAIRKITIKKCALVGLWFGAFQAIMPMIGFFLGKQFEGYIKSIDHWIAFGLLLLIGGNMVKEALSGEDEEGTESLHIKEMFVLAVATSIDALAVGITLGFMNVDILPAATFIGLVTFTLSAIGVKVGNVFGNRYQKKAELLGGVILIFLGVKILLEHMGIL